MTRPVPMKRAVLFALVAASCTTAGPAIEWAADGGGGEGGAADTTTEPLIGTDLSSVKYELAFDWGRATADTDGFGWTTKTTEGVAVHVERSYLTTYGADLVPCTTTGITTTAMLELGPAKLLLGSRTALAGHGGSHDQSNIEDPWVEDLARPASSIFGTREFASTSYCRVHYLAGASPDPTVEPRNAPEDAWMNGVSLYVEGIYSTTGALENRDDNRAFLIRLETADARLDVLEDDKVPTQRPGENAHVKVVRVLGSMFDGIDLGAQDTTKRDRAVMSNLMNDARIEVVAEE
jgi:hypothetical protein